MHIHSQDQIANSLDDPKKRRLNGSPVNRQEKLVALSIASNNLVEAVPGSIGKNDSFSVFSLSSAHIERFHL